MANKLEKIVGKIGKAATGLALATALYCAPDSDAQVIVSLRCVDSQTGEETREINPGKDYQIQVLGDNRGLDGRETYQVSWNMNIPKSINVVDVNQPNPIYLSNDFFETYQMNRFQNYVNIDGGNRATKPRLGVDAGPSNKVGYLGLYLISSFEESIGHQGNVKLKKVESHGQPNGISQPVKVKNLSVATITNIDDPNRRPVLLMDQDNENARYEFYGTRMPGKKLVLQSAANFPNGEWTNVYTNSAPGEPLLYSEPFTSEGNKMYRLMTSD